MHVKILFTSIFLLSFGSLAFEGFCDPLIPNSCLDRFPNVGGDAVTRDIPIDHVFAPKGFDDNDDAEVMAFGWLPSPCYLSPVGVASRSQNTLHVSARATASLSRICLPMAVPFLVPVHLGVLEAGTFLIQYVDELHNVKASVLNVDNALGDQVDNYTYAHVERLDGDEVERKIILAGRNPSDCFELDRVESIYNGKDTYSLLPIMKQVKPDCPRKMVPFRYTVDMPKKIDSAKVLWHVRRLDGKSINLIWDRSEGFSY